MTQSITHTTNSEFFNTYCKDQIEAIYNRFGETSENSLFTYKKYVMSDTYRQDEFYIADIKNEIPYKELKKLSENPRVFKYSNALLQFSGRVFEAESYVNTVDIIKAIHDMDSHLGQQILDIYHTFCANSSEAVKSGDNILEIQKTLQRYLKENQLYQTTFPITFDADDKDSVTQWFQSSHKKESPDLPSYNDLDYTPFMIKDINNRDYYILEDVSSDNLFIWDSRKEGTGTWYQTPRNSFKSSSDDMHDALFTSRQYITKNINENLNQFTLIAQYQNGKIVKATQGILALNSVQSFIYGELYSQGKVALDIDNSFSYMLANYRVDHDYYKHDLDEIHFFSFLKNIADYPGTLYYHNYQYHKNHENTPDLTDLDSRMKRPETNVDYSHLKNLSSLHQEQIRIHIVDRMEKLPLGEHFQGYLDKVKAILPSDKARFKRRID